MRIFSVFTFLAFSLFACDSGPANTNSETYKNLDAAGKLRFNQYLIAGSTLYEQHCSNCHKPDGTGLGTLIPPLAKSDYLRDKTKESIVAIKHGLNGSILVNGIEYNQPMPANPRLTAIEIAQIMTYIRNSWGNDMGMVLTEEVEKALGEGRGN